MIVCSGKMFKEEVTVLLNLKAFFPLSQNIKIYETYPAKYEVPGLGCYSGETWYWFLHEQGIEHPMFASYATSDPPLHRLTLEEVTQHYLHECMHNAEIRNMPYVVQITKKQVPLNKPKKVNPLQITTPISGSDPHPRPSTNTTNPPPNPPCQRAAEGRFFHGDRQRMVLEGVAVVCFFVAMMFGAVVVRRMVV